MSEGEVVSGLLVFKNWCENYERFITYGDTAKCTLQVDFGDEYGTVKLCFFLNSCTEQHKPEYILGNTYLDISYYLALYVTVLEGNGPLSFLLKSATTTECENFPAGVFSGKF